MAWITETILRRYGIAGSIVGETELHGGNVNRTYCVTVRDGALRTRYLVQKLNPEAVRKPRQMLRNMVVVTDHLIRKGIRTAKLYPVGVSGERFLELRRPVGDTVRTEYWRVEEYLDSAELTAEEPGVLLAMARAFGRFDAALADLPAGRLLGADKGFHDTYGWLRKLWNAAEKDPCGRTAEVRDELRELKALECEAEEISLRYASGEYPVRVTHNDTKFNNVLFTENVPPYGAIVIDFDTVMEGMVAYDFADSVRSTAKIVGGTAEEPEVRLDTEKFRVIAEGYLAETAKILNPPEIEAMAPCTLAVTAELSARYLTDYLRGDRYFKIANPRQNLQKARLNLAFAKDIRAGMESLKNIIREEAARLK